jgi:hypothetical protein
MRQTAGELGGTLKTFADEYPWLTLGSAAVAGALAARALSPPPAQRLSSPPPAARSTLSTSLEQALVDIFKGVAHTSILAALTGYQSTRHAHNGDESRPAP